MFHDYNYNVRIHFLMTPEEAKFLKAVATEHYDYKVREYAKQGAINGIFNCSNWSAEPEATKPYGYLAEFGDLDISMKAMEQAHFATALGYSASDTARLTDSIWKQLREAMDAIKKRYTEIKEAFPSERDPVAFAVPQPQ